MMKLVMDQTFHHHKHLLLIKIQLLMMSPSSKNKNKTLLNPMWLHHHKLMMQRNLKKITETAFTLEKMMNLLMVPLLMMNQMWYTNRNGLNLLKLHLPPCPWWQDELRLKKILSGLGQGIATHRQLMNFCAHFSFVSSIEPLWVEQALEDTDWLIAMQDDLNSFTRNEVWSLVERPSGQDHNIIGTK